MENLYQEHLAYRIGQSYRELQVCQTVSSLKLYNELINQRCTFCKYKM